MRLKNGFLSTEREAADWDRRNEKARDLFVENFLKEGGIHLNKDKNATKKIPPNSICACGSKKKYKNCCSNKKAITGLHEAQKPKVYTQDKAGVKVETAKTEDKEAVKESKEEPIVEATAALAISEAEVPKDAPKAEEPKAEPVAEPKAEEPKEAAKETKPKAEGEAKGKKKAKAKSSAVVKIHA